MGEREVKARLERALHKPITPAEWRHLKRVGLVEECLRDTRQEHWQELRDSAANNLAWIRGFYEDKLREQSGEIEADVSSGFPTEETVNGISGRFSKPFSARASALSALDRLRATSDVPSRARMHSTLFPRGGVDGTLPQWVFVLQVEAWVPADEVKEEYQRIQRAISREQPPPKTQARAFEVARFVWEVEHAEGERPSWPTLLKLWNIYHPDDAGFKSWRAFRNYFDRGAKAAPPRYRASNEEIINRVTLGDHLRAFDLWAAETRNSV